MGKPLPKVLVISSVDPFLGPGIVGLEHYYALRKGGIDADFLTKYPVKGHPEILSIYNHPSLLRKVWDRIREMLKSRALKRQVPGHYFFYEKETRPPVPVPNFP